MQYGNIYKHRNFIDVAFMVMDYPEVDSNYLTVNVEWYNTHYNYFMGIMEKLKITVSELPKYRDITEEILVKYNNAKN